LDAGVDAPKSTAASKHQMRGVPRKEGIVGGRIAASPAQGARSTLATSVVNQSFGSVVAVRCYVQEQVLGGIKQAPGP
jgi:hypothetical protein